MASYLGHVGAKTKNTFPSPSLNEPVECSRLSRLNKFINEAISSKAVHRDVTRVVLKETNRLAAIQQEAMQFHYCLTGRQYHVDECWRHMILYLRLRVHNYWGRYSIVRPTYRSINDHIQIPAHPTNPGFWNCPCSGP